MDRLKRILIFCFIVFGQILYSNAQNMYVKFIDTTGNEVPFNPHAFPVCKFDSTQTLVIDSIYSVIQYYYSEPEFEHNSLNCVIENKDMLSVRQFYDAQTNELIPVSKALSINFDFTYFVLRFKSDYFFTPNCYTAFGNSKLYVQNDIEFTDSISNQYSKDTDSNTKIEKPIQKAESRLAVYKNGKRQKVFYFLDENSERFAYPFGMAILNDKYLIAGYNTIPKKGYKEEFLQKIYIIDITTDMIIGQQTVSNIATFYVYDEALFMVYDDGEKELLIKCMIEKE